MSADAVPASAPPTPSTATSAARAAQIPPLAREQLATMLGTGFLFQACASGRFSFAAAAWLCLLPLAVLVRAGRLPVALVGAFGAVFFGRLVGWVGVVDDALVGAASAAALTVVALLAYRHVMRELPRAGSFALPLAVVVVEGVATRVTGLSLFPLSTTQAADVPLWRFVDVLTPLGVSFCVAWAQGAMAGWGESWIAEDPHDQDTRERGVRLGAAASFWVVFVVGHVGGLLRAPPRATAAMTPSTMQDAIVAAAAAVLGAMLVLATVARATRKSSSAATPSAEAGADSAG